MLPPSQSEARLLQPNMLETELILLSPFLKGKNPYHDPMIIFFFSAAPNAFFKEYAAFNTKLNLFQCNVCNKQFGHRATLLKHIENIHFPNAFVYECKYCYEQFYNRNKMYKHVSKLHKDRKDFAIGSL